MWNDPIRRLDRRAPSRSQTRDVGSDRPRHRRVDETRRLTKAGKPHRLPLSSQALDVLRQARKLSRGKYVFSGGRGSPMIGETTIAGVLLRAKNPAGHGLRTSFKGWEREHDVSELLSEFALAHVEGSKTVEALRPRRFAQEEAFRYAGLGPRDFVNVVLGPKAGSLFPNKTPTISYFFLLFLKSSRYSTFKRPPTRFFFIFT